MVINWAWKKDNAASGCPWRVGNVAGRNGQDRWARKLESVQDLRWRSDFRTPSMPMARVFSRGPARNRLFWLAKYMRLPDRPRDRRGVFSDTGRVAFVI